MLKKWSSVVVALILALVVGACTSGIGGNGGVRRSPLFNGRVEFADTGLKLLANKIVIGDQVITPSETGEFQGSLKAGKYEYTIDTYMGRYSGEVDYDGSSRLTLTVPEFEGWSEALFDAMLIWDYGGSARWPRGAELAVWIDESGDGFEVQDDWVQSAWDSLKEWSTQLNGAFTVRQAHSPDEADITYEWTTRSEIDGYAGLCWIWYRTNGSERGSLIQTRAQIAIEYADSFKLYLHESGHCIGLNHSFVDGHVMKQGSLYVLQQLHPTEVKMGGLLYSLPKGTGPLSAGDVELPQGRGYIHEYDPLNGTMTVVIPITVDDLR